MLLKDLPYSLKKRYIKEVLINKLKEKYIAEPFKEGVDFCVYEKVEEISNKYIRYDFIIYIDNKDIELSLSIGSTDTYIGKFDLTNISTDKIKVLIDNLLIKKSNTEITSNVLVKANFQIRKNENISPKPKFSFYKEHYEKIKAFLEENNSFDYLTILTSFKKITKYDVVDFDSNKMIFGNGNEDYSTINGMREYGPYKKPENISKFQLLFIYPDSEAANKLFGYFSRGYRHFPGLESYVGIPANLSEIKIKYNSLNSIVDEINNKLNQTKYENLIAVCIIPFSKTNATEEESKIYFKIKQILLNKNIPSQFIKRDKIFLENFHYSLPNIAIAMLAKIGGVPWKLSKSHYDELIIGFNVYIEEKDKYIGSCVFFDNEGIIQELNFYPTSNIEEICKGLFQSIVKYKKDKNKDIERIVIHYYKPLSNEENKEIKKALHGNFSNINYVVVEINDTKATTDLCFDLEYERLMPQSGTYIKLKIDEYLIFNNLRYWEKPINPINQEEFPIKVKIYDPNNTFDNQHHILISQVYEFSRLYWKSLKQKDQPVTTIYSKLFAEYVANFENQELCDNYVSKKTVWFI